MRSEPFGVGKTSKHWEGIEDNLSINRNKSPNGAVKALAHAFIAIGHVQESSWRNSDCKESPRIAGKARVAIKDLLFKHILPSVTTGGSNTKAPMDKGTILGSFAFKGHPTAGGSRGHRRRGRSWGKGGGRGRSGSWRRLVKGPV